MHTVGHTAGAGPGLDHTAAQQPTFLPRRLHRLPGAESRGGLSGRTTTASPLSEVQDWGPSAQGMPTAGVGVERAFGNCSSGSPGPLSHCSPVLVFSSFSPAGDNANLPQLQLSRDTRRIGTLCPNNNENLF